MVALLSYENSENLIVERKFTLQVDEMDELVKSKEVILDHFYTVLSLYGLFRDEVRKSVVVVHDRGGNIRYAMFDEAIIQIFCYCHLINNLVGKMLALEDVKKIITAASDLASYVKNAGLCTQLDSTLKTYCKTRWNSVYQMFDSIIKNYAKILNVLGDKQAAQAQTPSYRSNSSSRQHKQPLDYVCDVNLSAIEAIAAFLKPFRDMTLCLEGHKAPTIHMVWPVYLKIWDLLTPDVTACDTEYGHISEEMKSEGLAYIRANLGDFEPKDHHKIATILHPLLKNLNVVREAEKIQAYRLLDSMMREMAPEEDVIMPRRSSNKSQRFEADFLNDFCNEG